MSNLTNDGLLYCATQIVRSAGFSLRLFENDFTPDETSVLANFVQATFPGYVAKDLHASVWGAPSLSGAVATSIYPHQTWTASDPGPTVYGWYIVDITGKVVAKARYPTPAVILLGTVVGALPTLSVQRAAA